MLLGKVIKTGALIASGVLIGGLLSYNSEKTDIIKGIDSLKNIAIEAKDEATQATAERDKLKEDVEKLKSDLEKAKTKVEELTTERDTYKDRVLELEEQLNNTTSKDEAEELRNEIKRLEKVIQDLNNQIESQENTINDLTSSIETAQAEIQRLNDLIAFKDMLYIQTYEKAIEYENKIEELEEVLKEKDAIKNKKNVSRLFDIKPSIDKLSRSIYRDCFNIHMAVIDALLEYNVKDVESYIDIESIKQANALFNNYKDGFISKPDSARIVQKIIMANPYRKDVYEYLIKEDGDFGGDIRPFKDYLMDVYIQELVQGDITNLELSKEKVSKYAKYIGCDNASLYITRIDAIHTFENA